MREVPPSSLSTRDAQGAWAAALQDAGFALIETHISRVFLRGADVYKTKRCVNLGFLDFTSLEARARACRAEVELNRRLAPDVYLGVVALVRTPTHALRFEPPEAVADAAVVEWAVHMRRLADDDRADVLLAGERLGVEDVRAIAQMLATFHAGARCDASTATFGGPDQIAENVEENFAQVRQSIGEYVGDGGLDALATYQRAFLLHARGLLENRAHDGFVRDGHGDLRLEHLYRAAHGGYVAIDCIEFNDRFRFADVCADLAFLTMDLTVHGQPALAELLAALYAEESGDFGLYPLLDFYQSYRALVRAKVALLLALDLGVTQAARERGASEVRRHFEVACAPCRRALRPPRLIVTFGGIAAGKSTLAAALRARLALAVVSTDRTRKQLLGIAPTEARHDDAFSGAYGSAMTTRVYDEVMRRAAEVLGSGRSVVVDGSFRTRSERARVLALATRLGAEPMFLECWCAEGARNVRLAQRATAPSVSDGRAEIYDAFAASYEAPSELPPGIHHRIDTTLPGDAPLAQALGWMT